MREACGQALPWQPVGGAAGLVALAAPRDAVAGAAAGLYALRRDGAVLRRPAGSATAPWILVGDGPPRPRALAVADNHFFVLDQAGDIWSLPLGDIGRPARTWTRTDAGQPGHGGTAGQAGPGGAVTGEAVTGGAVSGEAVTGGAVSGGAGRLVALTAVNGRLVAADEAGRLLGRLPVPGAAWERLGDSGGCTVLTGHAGSLYGAAPGRPLLRRALP
jgi:hypothetical protein